MTVLVSGAGVAGLTLGLTLHQLGIPFRIFERVNPVSPMGVGINIQPNAVRELFQLGLQEALDAMGVRTRDYGFYTKKGLEIWTEPRGTWAGYRWPQYSIHRGRLQMLLHDTLLKRAGPECLVAGCQAVGFENTGDEVLLFTADASTGERSTCTGTLLIGADGIHSAIRKQMYPQEGNPHWGGAILWRGTSRAKTVLSGASMVLAGHATQRVVAYPISVPDSEGLCTMNWIAERTVDPAEGWRKEDWNRKARLEDFLPHFEDWDFGWLNVPGLIRSADAIYEYPMVDRDPVASWTQGRVTLMGDAAHPTYPVGSNGASQAIMDARYIGAALLQNGLTPDALLSYEHKVLPATSRVTLANRGAGPDAIMQMVEDRCGGHFIHIHDVMDERELAAHAEKYKKLAGLDMETVNTRPDTVSR